MMRSRPTEYRGIVFDSKCEAMFARFLDLDDDEVRCIASGGTWTQERDKANHTGDLFACGFFYHPIGWAVDRWQADFLRWRTWFCEGPAQHLAFFYELIEYKPSRPTQTYVREFAKRCEVLRETNDHIGFLSTTLYYGSIFTSDRGLFRIYDDVSFEHISEDWLGTFEEEVRETRFDLVTA